MLTIELQEIKSPSCPIEGWKETDNCLRCKYFGGLVVKPSSENSVNVSLLCKNV